MHRETTRRGYLHKAHGRAMSTLAAQIAIAIENATLYERLAREEQRMDRDLAMAREVQHHLLPPSCPSLPGAELAARYNPAHAIAGGHCYLLLYKISPPRLSVISLTRQPPPPPL